MSAYSHKQKHPEYKKVQGQTEAALWVSLHMTKIFDIKWGQKIIYQKILLATWMTYNTLLFSQLWLALSLGHFYNSDVVPKGGQV